MRSLERPVLNVGILTVLLTAVVGCGEDEVTGPGQPDAVGSVSVTPPTHTLAVGESHQFTATVRSTSGTVLRDRTVTWSSDDDAVASISGTGLVTAHTPGPVEITATSDGKSGSASLEVTTETVASVTVEPAEGTVVAGDSLQLTAVLRSVRGTLLSDRAVAWTSADDATAEVSRDGMVKGRTEGPVRITAESEGKSGHATIEVIAAPASGGTVVMVTVDPSTVDLEEGDGAQFVATALDADGREVFGRAVRWTSDDPGVVYVDAGGTATALRPGTVAVKARVDGATGTATVHVTSDSPFDLLYDGWSGVPGQAPELYLVDPRDPIPSPVRPFPAGIAARDPAASPDGTKIAYVVATASGSRIYVANRDGSEAIALSSGSEYDDQPAWSPDGQWIAFRRWPWPEGEDSDIWVMRASDGSGAVNLTDDLGASNQASPAWSPELDGTFRLAFSHSVAGMGHLYTMSADGTDRRRITSRDDAYDDQPSWSPDGSAIAFVRAGPGFSSDIWVVGATSGGERPLRLLFGSQLFPAWSPDGRMVAFVSRHESMNGGEPVDDVYTVWEDGSRLARRTEDVVHAQNVTWITRR